MSYDHFPIGASHPTLLQELTATRERFDALAAFLRHRHGEASPLVSRAEEVSAAVQRLEWQFARSQAGSASA